MEQPGGVARSIVTPPLAMGLRLSLSVMMFLQFAIWGAWFVVFFPYLKGKGFSDGQAAAIMGNMALGAIFATLFAGYIADRFVASERMMGILHLTGAGLLWWMAQIQDPAQYWTLFGVSLAYALVYNPTLALANSIAFSHVPDATRDFPGIRVLGTLGWIAVGFLIDVLPRGGAATAAATNAPLLLAAGLAAVLGVYSFFLPHTPPAGKEGSAVRLLLEALGLFRNFSFAVFFTVSFVITIVLAFYYTVTADYLQQAIGIKDIGSTMALGQIAELILLPLLPIFLYKLGMKWVLALGMLAWGVRYALFSVGGPVGTGFALVIIGVALHGVCFDFFFAAGFIHVDNEAPRDIRASGQALFSFLTYGLGMWLGSLLCGQVKAYFTHTQLMLHEGAKWVPETETNWRLFWLVPSAGVLLCLAVFVLFFQVRSKPVMAPLEEGAVALPVSGETGIVPAVPGETGVTPAAGG
jgi:nucleoside transporter